MFASDHLARGGPALAAAVRERVPAPLTRYAPAPTGALHLGHVVNAVFVWGLARAAGGRVLLRIEDHDRQRARREHEATILEDLDWLGFEADVFPSAAYRASSCEARQSERGDVYRRALQPLIERGLVYACDCSRARIAEAVPAGHGELRYDGRCRGRGLPLGEGVGWRLRMEPGVERFDDLILGSQEQDPAAQCGDVLVRDRLGNWTYQWAVAVDDWLQGIALVVRGTDILASTGRQIRMARLLGREHPAAFAHHPLVMKSSAQKVSKSDGDTGVRDLRAAGWSAARVVGEAAALVGLAPPGAELPAKGAWHLFT